MNQNDDDIFLVILSELKYFGVKVPKIKKLKSNISKQISQEKLIRATNNKIFGVSLCDQEWILDGDVAVPKFLASVTLFLKRFLSKEIGLFRKAGSISRQKELRVKLENGETLDKSEPNDVASLLKQWLRELPEPLIPSYLHELFIRCHNVDNRDNCTAAVLATCRLLPADHLQTLKYLLQFLAKIAAQCDKNKMDANNLALIIAPNIFIISSETIDKSSNNMVQQYSSIVRILIENADSVGAFSKVNSVLPGQESRKSSDAELNFSLETLDFSPKCKKKRRSGGVQDLFSGIRKIVGQSSAGRTTPDKPQNRRASVSRSASKRKAEPDEQSILAVKKQAISKKEISNGDKKLSPRIKNDNDTPTSKKKSHSRRKSFGLLRRKEKKRLKSPQSTIDLAVSEQKVENPSIFVTDVKHPLTRTPEVSPEVRKKISFSPLLSQADIEQVITGSSDAKNSCFLTVPKALSSKIVTTTSDSYLIEKTAKLSPNNPLQSNRVGKSSNKSIKSVEDKACALEANSSGDKRNSRKRKSLPVQNSTDISLLNEKGLAITLEQNLSSALSDISLNMTPVKQRNTRNSKIHIDKNFLTSENAEVKNSSIKKISSSSMRKISPVTATESQTKKLNSRHLNVTTVCREEKQSMSNIVNENAVCTSPMPQLKRNSSKRSNTNASKSSKVSKEERRHSIKRQEAFIVKRSKSTSLKNEVDNVKILDGNCEIKPHHFSTRASYKCESVSNGFEKENAKYGCVDKECSARRVRPGSNRKNIIRGRPNTVNTGLPSDVCVRVNNESLLPSNSGDSDVSWDFTPESNDENTSCKNTFPDSLTEYITLSSSSNTFIIKNAYGSDSTNSSISKNDENNKHKKRSRVLSNSDSKISSLRKSDRKGKKNSSFSGSSSKTVENDGKVCMSKKLDTLHPLSFKESICISSMSQSINNDFKTPSKDTSLDNSEMWVSGKIAFETPLPEEVFNKRESIAMILRNNPGHVQAKVNLYDNQGHDVFYSTPNGKFSTPNFVHKTSSLQDEKCVFHDSIQTRSALKPCSRNVKMHQKLTFSKSVDSTPQSNNSSKMKFRKFPLPPPPKFNDSDLNASPKTSYPLKELTNITLELENSSVYHTPEKINFSPRLKNHVSDKNVFKTPETNLNPIKSKRNSFSGHTPYKLLKVARCESSPVLLRISERATAKQLKKSPSLSTVLDDEGISKSNQGHSSLYETNSALSIEKLRSDQMLDEWQYEM